MMRLRHEAARLRADALALDRVGIDALPFAVLVVDAAGRLVMTNSTADALLQSRDGRFSTRGASLPTTPRTRDPFVKPSRPQSTRRAERPPRPRGSSAAASQPFARSCAQYFRRRRRRDKSSSYGSWPRSGRAEVERPDRGGDTAPELEERAPSPGAATVSAPTPRAAPSWWARLRDLLRPARLQLREDQTEDLFEALRGLGAAVSERDWQMAGATERTVFQVDLDGRRARIILDSFNGPLLVGPAALIGAVEERVTRGCSR